MRKILVFICLFSLFSTNLFAECWGTEKKGRNGNTFCVSNQNVANWYSAFAWCDAQGRRLATINEVCDAEGVIFGGNSTGCQGNLRGEVIQAGQSGWTASAIDASSAYKASTLANSVAKVETASKMTAARAICY